MVLRAVVSRVETLLKVSIALSSIKVYRRAWALMKQASVDMGLNYTGSEDLPLSSQHVMLFVGYLSHTGFAAASITSYTSAIGYIHKLLGMPDPTALFMVQKLLAACNKVNTSADTRLPITIVILQRLSRSLDHTVQKPYNRQLFRTMYTVAFFGFMRLAEITQDKNKVVALHLDQVQICESAVVITIKKFKHNLSLKPIQIVLPAQQDKLICPVHQMRLYIQNRGISSGPLFRYFEGKPVSRNFFNTNLKSALKFCQLEVSLYKSHSFRIGAASYYAQLGFSDAQIRDMGRWNSNAFVKYIRTDRIGIALQCCTDPL